MYNRYIPGTNGVYERQIVREPDRKPASDPCPKEISAETNPVRESATAHSSPVSVPALDIGDLLLLCILLLLLLDSDQDDILSILITAAAFLFL